MKSVLLPHVAHVELERTFFCLCLNTVLVVFLNVLSFPHACFCFIVENAGGEMECSSPGSPNGTSSSASPHREGSSPLSTGPGSGLGHSLPNLQAIPRYPSGLDHGRGSHIWLSNQLAHNQRVMSHTNSLSSKDPAAHMEVQSPYSSQTISDGIEEEEESDMAKKGEVGILT
ncbi:PREDICTED: uncharacterized protein LOC107338097 [Acropora digitifera]|uniref:uncharacterized protein LOC107338097 n=1 Tax=Acropora digitifera TaxID=70779 RepID=UPI00077B24ED|nr:PREDICTED: uncharacterized protein LOC107338097 [Acropora digitifera]